MTIHASSQNNVVASAVDVLLAVAASASLAALEETHSDPAFSARDETTSCRQLLRQISPAKSETG